MLFGQVPPDPNFAGWAMIITQIGILIGVIATNVIAVIAALKSQQNGIKADKAIAQNEFIIKQTNGLIDKATVSAHDLGYAKGVQDTAAAQVPNITAAVAAGVAAAKKAEDVKKAT